MRSIFCLSALMVAGLGMQACSSSSTQSTGGPTLSQAMVKPGAQGNTFNGRPAGGATTSSMQPISNGALSNNLPLPGGWGSSATTVLNGVKGDTFNGVSTAQAVAQQHGTNILPFTNLLPKNWGGGGAIPGLK